jgi:hypothetical protein
MEGAEEVHEAGHAHHRRYRGFVRGRRVVIAGQSNKIALGFIRILPNEILLSAVHRRVRYGRDNPRKTG